MRAVVVAPAHVETDALGGNSFRGLVDGIHVQVDHGEESLQRLVLEEAGALHGEIGAVDLEDEAPGVDQRVLLAHLAGEGSNVGLVRLIVRGEENGGDDPR
jgi:hypothetical protein